jgi:acetyl-CoA synthetase
MPPALADELGRAGIAPLVGIDDALHALEAAAFVGAQLQLPRAEAPWSATLVQGASTAGLPRACETLSELEAKRLLAKFGLDVPAAVECSIASAPGVAQRLGFPVVVKIANQSIAHKSDVGGVALSLGSADAVATAAARMAALGDRVLVERMVDDAIAELIVGVVRDPQFGMALLLGAGGVLAELMSDTVTLLLPVTRTDIEQALRRLRVWRLVEGYRGRCGDGAAVVRAVEAVVAFADAHRDRLEELDINPLRVLPERAVAVDALIRLRTA